MEQQVKKREDQVVAGTVGAFLGSLLGVACIIIVGRLGYVSALSGVVMAVCALKGYELLGGGMSCRGAVISGVLILVMTYFADRLDWAFLVSDAYDVGIGMAFQSVGYLLDVGAIEGGAYWGNLIMLYLFTLLGAVPTVIASLRSSKGEPLSPLGMAESSDSADGQPEGHSMQLYPAARGWMRPLRTSALVAMFLPLMVTLALLAVPVSEEMRTALVLGAMGSLAGMLIIMAWFLARAGLFQADNVFFVRTSDGTLWRVLLQQLNALDTYRFTSGVHATWSGVRWFRLQEEDKARAEYSIARAINDLRSGVLMPGSALSRCVVPLLNLELIKEDHWQWKLAYQLSRGPQKISIPKAYPDLQPIPGTQAPQKPVPAHWGILLVSVLCTVALTTAGITLGLAGSSPSGGADAGFTVASAPASTASGALDGVAYQVDGDWIDGGDGVFYDPDTDAIYALTVYRDVSEAEAIDALLQPISDYRMDSTFDRFHLDRTNENLAPITGQSGLEYRYNIISLYFTDGTIYHMGVTYFDEGTLVMVEAIQTTATDESSVKSDLLFVMESLLPTRPGSEQI